MPDQPKQPRSISEISHLFLSSVREKQTGGAERPMRLPPGARAQAAEELHSAASEPRADVDELTPEEYAQVLGGAEAAGDEPAEVRIPPVTAVIAQHLNGRAHERVKDYARHLAANGERIGLLEVDASEIKLMCFERSIEPNLGDPGAAAVTEHFDTRFMTEALDEMSCDVDRWLLVLPNLRSLEARGLLKEIDRWTLLSTCDHDGVVSCYRTLKGLASVHRPRMTLALMESTSETQAAKIHRKLCSVCLQFLGIELEGEAAVRPTRAVAEHLVVHCRPTRDKAQLAGGAQWLVVANFLARAKAQGAEDKTRMEDGGSKMAEERAVVSPLPIADCELPIESNPQSAARVTSARSDFGELSRAVESSSPKSIENRQSSDSISDVIDLPGDAADEQAVLGAILAGARGELIECPVRAPMCPEARLAVTRERGLVILAVARKGLQELRSIAQAYRWLVENRALIGMAVPQLSIDGLRHPRLRLLVDHADMTADVLGPMLESGTVSVQAYRKLRWGGKTGLLLEAA